MGIEMLAKDSPRTTEKVNSYKKAASRSILANNKEAVDENGVFLSRKERKKRKETKSRELIVSIYLRNNLMPFLNKSKSFLIRCLTMCELYSHKTDTST